MERPILFSTPMVQAILDGRKTQTRRTRNLELINQDPNTYAYKGYLANEKIHVFARMWRGEWVETKHVRCPYGKASDVLWVRETWNITDPDDSIAGEFLGPRTSYTGSGPNGDILWRYVYKASSPEKHPDTKKGRCRWKPSIHMPKEACRIRLEITNIRVERLQNISEKDAIAEGVEGSSMDGGQTILYKSAYADLWNAINGKGSWDSNPWVWVIEFKKI